MGMSGDGRPPTEIRKTVTVVFCDLAGSTELGEELDPESLRRVMSRFYEEMSHTVERHGGTAAKFIGDAVMAVFGIPVLHEDDALRAVRAAAEMGPALDRLNDELQAEMGRPPAGSGRRQHRRGRGRESGPGQSLAVEEVVGDAVNVAARLERAAATGEVLIGGGHASAGPRCDRRRAGGAARAQGQGETGARLETAEGGAGREGGYRSRSIRRSSVASASWDCWNRRFQRALAERRCQLVTLVGARGHRQVATGAGSWSPAWTTARRF